MGKVVPHIAILVARFFVVEFVQQSTEFGVGIVGRRFGIDTPRRFPDQREPLLPISTTIGADKVLVFAQQDLVRHLFNVAGLVFGQGSVASKSRIPSIRIGGH